MAYVTTARPRLATSELKLKNSVTRVRRRKVRRGSVVAGTALVLPTLRAVATRDTANGSDCMLVVPSLCPQAAIWFRCRRSIRGRLMPHRSSVNSSYSEECL